MAVVIQEIGFPLDLTKGKFVDTVVINKVLQLKEITKDENGVSIYPLTGSWESEPIYIKDKIASYKNIARNTKITGSGSYKVYTSTSSDGVSWSSYIELDVNGSIQSPLDNYIKIKIEISSGLTMASLLLDDFNMKGKYNNPFVNSSDGVLEIKKTYVYPMQKSDTWKDEGKLFSTSIPKTEFKKIDRMSVQGDG